jgi:hypothetical protein
MVPVAREVFEYQMIPWVGPEYAAWLRTSARPHPADEHRVVLVPERIYRVFQERQPGERLTPAQLDAMRFPRLPDEDELEAAYVEQRVAAHTGDKRRLTELHQNIEQLQQRLESARRALDIWQRTDPAELEERIAWELTRAPHADVLVGIPGEANRA